MRIRGERTTREGGRGFSTPYLRQRTPPQQRCPKRCAGQPERAACRHHHRARKKACACVRAAMGGRRRKLSSIHLDIPSLHARVLPASRFSPLSRTSARPGCFGISRVEWARHRWWARSHRQRSFPPADVFLRPRVPPEHHGEGRCTCRLHVRARVYIFCV